jgi:hypothetical protein
MISGSLSPSEWIVLGLAAALAILGGILGYIAWKNSRVTPEERERRRREMLVATGKMGDATLLEIRDGHLIYSYDVRGVEYTASQDVTRLVIPTDLAVSGPVLVRYDARNPANSIVVAERWSGLRA